MNKDPFMNVFQIKCITFLITFFSGVIAFGQTKKQTKKDTLRTENVTVIKTFNPTINDAFKIETPPSEEDKKTEPKAVSLFRIESVPVASTFVPEKAKSIAVKRERRKLPPQNYASLAGGNFGNAEAEAFVSYPAGRDAEFSALLLHQSSQGKIDNIRVDDFYYDTDLQLSYKKQDRKTPWGLFFQAQHQLYNWYGIPEGLILSNTQLDNIDPNHTFMDVNIGGDITFDNPIIKGLNTQLRYFFDDYDSNEINLTANPHFNFDVDEYNLDLPVEVDVLAGSFKPKSFIEETKYQIVNFGVKPSIFLSYNDIDFKIGASGFVSADTENSKTSFYIYPNILATYQFKDTGISVFGGLTGGLKQNTYHNASAENLFVAPTLGLTPTSEQFNLHAGVQGSFNSELSYQVKVAYNAENDKALYQKLGNLNFGTEASNFGYNNAFGYVYADVNTGTLSGDLNYSVTDSYGISLSASFSTYNTKGQEEAWNLPQIKTSLHGNYNFNEKLNFETSIFFIGTRKDFDHITNSIVDVDSIFDVNIGANYSITENWKAFIKGNNITNQNYERWLGYPVQSAQGLVGIRYLFK